MARSHRSHACVLLGVTVLACTAFAVQAARQEPEPLSDSRRVQVNDARLASALAEAKAAAGKPRLFHENLVDERPLVRQNGSNWYSYNYSVFANYEQPSKTFLGLQSVERGNMDAGVLNLTLEWKPMPGLTAEMVEWMFGNLHKKALSPFDNKIYPMYTILHPTDHITFLAKPADKPVTRGSTFTFIENPNSGCFYQPDSFDAPWVCPTNRTGFTKATPEEEWRRYPQTNATLVVDRLDRNSCVWYKERELPHFGKRVVITSKMTWEDTPDGLVLRASRLAGIMSPNKTDVFETAQPANMTGDLLRQANEIVRVAYLDGNFDDNMTASAYAFAMHWGQEWTGLKDWLPQVFNSSRKLAKGGAHAADEDDDDFATGTTPNATKPAQATAVKPDWIRNSGSHHACNLIAMLLVALCTALAGFRL